MGVATTGCSVAGGCETLDELIQWHRFCVDQAIQPAIWLPVFDDQIVNVVTLGSPGRPTSDTSVWYGHTHDAGIHRLFDSIEALLDVVCDAAEAGALSQDGVRLGLGDDCASLDDWDWNPFRLARCPGSYRYPDPPEGTDFNRFPEPNWPQDWLFSLGITQESLPLHGATHTIAELVAQAAHGPVTGTIRGMVVTGGGNSMWWHPVVDDGTGRLVVACETAQVPIAINVGQEGEFDVILESAALPEPMVDEDPRVVALAERFQPRLPTALATAARPVPDE